MKTVVIVTCVVIMLFIGLVVVGGIMEDQKNKVEACRDIQHQMHCAEAWTKYRLSRNPGDRPIFCRGGEEVVNEYLDLFAKFSELDCIERLSADEGKK